MGRVADINVVGGELQECSAEPLTGFYRDGCCATGPEDAGSHIADHEPAACRRLRLPFGLEPLLAQALLLLLAACHERGNLANGARAIADPAPRVAPPRPGFGRRATG